LEAEWRVRERLIQAFEDEFGCGLAAVTPLTMGSWVGGDRDGNPFVTAEITLAAARSARRAVLGHYGRALADLTARLSVSERLAAMSPELRASLERDRQELPGVWEQNRRRNADEPLRLKVSFMRARVEADPPGYASPDELERDLRLSATSLRSRSSSSGEAYPGGSASTRARMKLTFRRSGSSALRRRFCSHTPGSSWRSRSSEARSSGDIAASRSDTESRAVRSASARP